MRTAMRNGQVLVLVLLIVVVALAVGLSVASRNITNLRSSAQTDQSQRAFSTAEGGVEDVLSRLSAIATSGALSDGSETYNVPVGSLTANVTVKSNNTYQSVIDLGSVGQIDLAAANGTLRIDWGSCSDPSESPPATIAVTQYINNAGAYSQDRKIFQGQSDPSRSESGVFDSSAGHLGPVGCPSATGFKRSETVSILANAKLLRIRPFWVKTTVKVSAADGTSSIPVQTYDISSTAKTDAGITRKVQVQRTALPQLPAVFDYVLFSSGDISK